MKKLLNILKQASIELGHLTEPPWSQYTHVVAKVRDEVRNTLIDIESMKCTSCSLNGLRWHKLRSLSIGDEEVEVMAATCIDGIGVIVRWKKEYGGWSSEAIDTEGGQWNAVDDECESNEIPPEPPLIWDDISNKLY